jgi:hypothetical protein
VLVEHLLPQPLRNRVDQLLAAQDPPEVALVEDLLRAGEPKRSAADHDRFAVWALPVPRGSLTDELGNESPQLLK